jgi:hypothetical protein
MIEIERACECAQLISDSLAEAQALSEGITTSMGKLAADPLLHAASRRETLNASIARFTSELGIVLQSLATKQGWPDLTITRLATIAPVEAGRLQATLQEINTRAADLRDLDARNRARGSRALAFLRSALGTQPSSVAAYDRRGAVTPGRALSTGSRTA